MSSGDLNLWSTFLRESSKRTQNQESTCIFVGDEHCGKRQLASVLCGLDTDKERVTNNIVSYNYFDIDDKDLEMTTRVNTWLFQKNIFESANEILKSTYKTDKVSSHRTILSIRLFIILLTLLFSFCSQLILAVVLDLSKPDTCLTSLHKWLVKISTFTKKYFTEVANDNAKAQKEALLDYLKNVRKTKGSVTGAVVLDETEEEEGEDNHEGNFEGNFISEFFGLPIVVVGSKSDLVVSDSSAAMKQARELQGKIRSVCLEVGAGLIFTTAAGPALSNCAELKKYIMHRLYPTQIGMELSLEDKLEKCFIPAGFDTADLIKISCAVKHVPAEVQSKLKADIAKKVW